MTAGAMDRELEYRAYLLGALPPERQEEIEERFLGDEGVHAELQATADDLIHAYLAGALPVEDRPRFETHFLATPRRRERVAFVRSLLAAADRVRTDRRAAPWRSGALRVLPWAAVLVLGLAGGGLSVGERRRSERELAAARQREDSLRQELTARDARLREREGRGEATKEPEIATWILEARGERGPGGPEAFITRGYWVRLRVPLGHDMGVPLLRASLQTPEGLELLRVGGLRETTRPDGAWLDVMVPAGLLRPGTYLLSIQRDAPGASEELAATTFVVRSEGRR